MKILFYLACLLFTFSTLCSVAGDTSNIPLNRRVFHDNIKAAQQRADKADGKLDGMIRISNIDDVNLQITDAIFRKVNVLRNDVETSTELSSNNDKIRNLRLIENLVKTFTSSWKTRKLSPTLAPELVSNFTEILKAVNKGENYGPYISKVHSEVGAITSEIFKDYPGYAESKKILFLKYARLHPEKILSTIAPYVDDPFADELILLAFNNNPSVLYNYAQASNTPQGKLIKRNPDKGIQIVVKLSTLKNALFYFPFLDDLIHGKKTIEEIGTVAGDDTHVYDSVGYFKLMVKTQINYYNRLVAKDTPIAFLGANGLTEWMQNKAIQHFVKPINELHEVNNPAIRFKALDPLSPEELYYMIVLGENEIYTSSYKNSFDLMMKRMGPKPKGDSLLMLVNFDHFKKFIKMAAGYNRLDTFLRTMNGIRSTKLMQAFVSNLDNTNSLEDAVDVADAFGSIRNPALLKSMLKYVSDNERMSSQNDNPRAQNIYHLLKIIFLSSDSTNKINISKEIGIPPVFTVDNTYLSDDSGRIVEQVFFYGDKDGKESYASYMTSFPKTEWKITQTPEWTEIKSLKGKPVWIYANLPLDNETDKDQEAQQNLIAYLDENGLRPSIVIHRGHSYHLPYTIEQLPESAKIIMLGSCGGYKNLKTILDYCPEAHIISTKQIGARDVNKPILEAINNTIRASKDIDWRDMWGNLDAQFSKGPRDKKDLFDDYIPPHKNLGSLFIKAYTRSTK